MLRDRKFGKIILCAKRFNSQKTTTENSKARTAVLVRLFVDLYLLQAYNFLDDKLTCIYVLFIFLVNFLADVELQFVTLSLNDYVTLCYSKSEGA